MNSRDMSSFLVSLDHPTAADISQCGGKSAGLHLLMCANLPVPPGFAITTRAFESILGANQEVQRAIAQLRTADEGPALREHARLIRETILATTLPDAFVHEIIAAWRSITQAAPVAVRSSATAEDLHNASFAGQLDTYLGMDAPNAVVESIRACWASLFTERAVIYRRSRGFDDSRVSMAVVVQRMVNADAAGVLFTADPISNHRDIFVVEAIAGLGEAFVSGHAAPERYRIRTRDGKVSERIGTDGKPLNENQGLLSAEILAQMHALGQKAQRNAGTPVDIEWAVEKNQLWLLQSRPITTLWPLPEGNPLPGWRVFLSFGHMQVYTAPLSRVGASMFARIMPLRRDPQTGLSTLIKNVGERVYIDLTPALSRAPFNKLIPRALESASEAIAERLKVAANRDEIHSLPTSDRTNLFVVLPVALRFMGRALNNIRKNPKQVRDIYLDELQHIIHDIRKHLQAAGSLENRFNVMFDEFGELLTSIMTSMFPRLMPTLVISRFLPAWIAAIAPEVDSRVLLQGLEGNITTEMDMVLADLADVARDNPALVTALKSIDPVQNLEKLRSDENCIAFFQAWDAFLHAYGHRSAGEIDPGVPRWREDPRIPLRSIAGSLDRPRGALRAQHRTLARRAEECRNKLVDAAHDKPLGFVVAPVTKTLIDYMRTLLGAREHHKFYLIQAVDLLRSVVLEAGEYLAKTGALDAPDDIWFIELPEIKSALADARAQRTTSLQALVSKRRELRDRYAHITPPAVFTSDGEAISPTLKHNVPKNSLAGTAVSGGLYEGIARVVHDPATEDLGAGEILVARFTDPGWTPLFGHAGALVMEVGGQMTHGSVIAREIGIPAVVAVEAATQKIRSGDRIRVDGERGFVTVLEGALA